MSSANFGQGDASFQAAGGEAGIRQLVVDFYDIMQNDPRGKAIFAMHPSDLETTVDKLALFLCGWLGGPRLFREKYGQIHIPVAHSHLPISAKERDAWLYCMEKAAAKQPFSEAFKSYLRQALSVPAERCRNR